MSLENTHDLIAMHKNPGSGYMQNAAKLVLGEVMRGHGQATVDSLIREYGLEELWDIKPGIKFENAFKS